mgnify:FL=1
MISQFFRLSTRHLSLEGVLDQELVQQVMETKYNTQSVQMHILEDLTIENQSEHEDIWNVLDDVTPTNDTASFVSSEIQNYLTYP